MKNDRQQEIRMDISVEGFLIEKSLGDDKDHTEMIRRYAEAIMNVKK